MSNNQINNITNKHIKLEFLFVIFQKDASPKIGTNQTGPHTCDQTQGLNSK